jgi:hypothetical protein
MRLIPTVPPNTRLTRWQHLRQVLLRPMWLIALIVWSVFSFATDVRDNFLSLEIRQAWETRAVLRWLPAMDWHVWLIGVLTIAVLALFETTFRLRRDDNHLLQKWIGTGAFHADFLRLYNRGKQLSDTCDDFPQKALPEAETEQWVQDVEAFISTRTTEPLNDLYLKMFHEDARLSKPFGSWAELPQSKLRYKIDCHVYQLHQIQISLNLMRWSGIANQLGAPPLSEARSK